MISLSMILLHGYWISEVQFTYAIHCKDFKLVKKFKNDEIFLNMGDENQISIQALGVVGLVFKSNSVTIVHLS